MKIRVFLFLTGVLIPSAAWSEPLTVSVTRTDDSARPDETIVVPFSKVAHRFPKVRIDHLTVTDLHTGQTVPMQVTNFLPEEHRDNYRDLLFQHDFAAGEKSAEFRIEAVDATVPPIPTKVFARYVPERFDDFAWENDRIAHRIYGPALNTPAAGTSQMISSGIDVWCKRVRYPIVDRWYMKGHYHEDSGEGLDMYDVNKSRGCGGTGIWDGHEIHSAGLWQNWKVLANGPLRAVFEIGYAPWDGGQGVQVSEVKRFTVDAGHNLDAIEDTFTFSGPSELVVAIGIAIHPKVKANLVQDPQGRSLSQWEEFSKNGSVGEAVVLAPETETKGFAEDVDDHIILVKVKSGVPIHYSIGAGWSLSGDFPNREAWVSYVGDMQARAGAPLALTYSK